MKTVFFADIPSISVKSWFNTLSAAPPASPTSPTAPPAPTSATATAPPAPATATAAADGADGLAAAGRPECEWRHVGVQVLSVGW